jgi:hypothetical protein
VLSSLIRRLLLLVFRLPLPVPGEREKLMQQMSRQWFNTHLCRKTGPSKRLFFVPVRWLDIRAIEPSGGVSAMPAARTIFYICKRCAKKCKATFHRTAWKAYPNQTVIKKTASRILSQRVAKRQPFFYNHTSGVEDHQQIKNKKEH